jgi:hypothetical protein
VTILRNMPLEQRRYETPAALAACAIAVLVLAYPALTGQALLNPNSDQYIAGFAFRDFAAQSLRNGNGFPLWNPYLFGGMPYVAAMHGDIFYPTFLLRMILPTDAAMTWGMILHVWLAGVFTRRFLRTALGLGFAASLIGGIAYMIGGNVGGLVSPGHDGKIFVSALLPLVLLLVHRSVRDGRRWAWGALVIAITLAVLTPHPQLLQYLLLVAGAYALFLAVGMARAKASAAKASAAKASAKDSAKDSPRKSSGADVERRSVAIKRLLVAAVCVGAGLLGGAIQFWPLLEYTPYSPRAGGKGWEHAVSYSMPPEELINTYLPQFSGILEMYSGRNVIHLHSEYLGVVTLVLAGLAFGYRKTGLEQRRMFWFFVALLVLSLLWAMGGFTPFFSLVYALVPGTKYFRAPSTMLYVVSFAVAALAAMGAHQSLTAGIRTRYAVGWVAAAALIALLTFSGGLSSIARAVAFEPRAMLVEENRTALNVGALRSLLFVVLTLGALLAAARSKARPAAVGWALAALLVVDLWTVERRYWKFSPPASVLYAGDAVTNYLRTIPQPGRVLTLAGTQLTGTMRDPFLGSGEGKGTGLMVHGIRSVVGYHGNELGRYDELTMWDTDEYMARVSNPNLWRLLNVRYLYTNAPRPAGDPLTLVAGPATNAAGNTAYLYQFPEENPYAWVTPLAVAVPGPTALATLLDQQFDPARVAMLDEGTGVPTVTAPSALPQPSDIRATVTRWTPGAVSLALDKPAPAGSTLLVSENWYPGWTARVDGRDVPTGRADYTLIGVGLPAGARNIELTFTSPRYERGKLITLLVLLAGAGAMIAGFMMERRRPRPEAAGT